MGKRIQVREKSGMTIEVVSETDITNFLLGQKIARSIANDLAVGVEFENGVCFLLASPSDFQNLPETAEDNLFKGELLLATPDKGNLEIWRCL